MQLPILLLASLAPPPQSPAAAPALERSRVSAPIAPDAIYVGRDGATASLSVVDLYGFGGGTGSPLFDPACPIGPGMSDFPNDPNVKIQGTLLVPPLAPGASARRGRAGLNSEARG